MVNHRKRKSVTYELLPPDGGWGYVVTLALALGFSVTVVPMVTFGLIYGNFLASIGDETTGTTLTNGIFNTALNFTGLIANGLLRRYSFRLVALIGACIYFIGAFSIIFVSNLWQTIASFGVIQGLGMGLLFPSLFTALNSYFNQKINLMNSLAQTFMIVAMMLFPFITKFLMDHYGFRGTVAILAALSLHTVVAALTLQPVKWHMIRKKLDVAPENAEELKHLKPLLEDEVETGEGEGEVETTVVSSKPRASIISIGDRAFSVTTLNQIVEEDDRTGFWNTIKNTVDISLFKSPIYVNISFGLALSYTSDIAFISIIPLVLNNAGFDTSEITLLMTIYFACDLAGRILLSILSAFCTFKNRYLLLGSAFLSALFRTAFVMGHSFWWKMSTLSVLGFLRAFIQTPLPLVISDEYSNNFAVAFSLYMVVCGFVSLVFGFLMSWVKSLTGSDVMVVHLLTLAYLTCTITWIVELLYRRKART